MKALKYILYSLLIAVAAGLLIYLGLVEKKLETSDAIKCCLIIAAAILGMVKPSKARIANKKRSIKRHTANSSRALLRATTSWNGHFIMPSIIITAISTLLPLPSWKSCARSASAATTCGL